MVTVGPPHRTSFGSTTFRARLLTLVWLVSSSLSILLLPLVGVARESSPFLRAAGAAGIAALFVTALAVMWSAVTPWISNSWHVRTQAAFVLAAVASVPLVAPLSAETWNTWAWLGAAIIGVSPLLWRWRTTLAVAVGAAAVSVAVARVGGGSVLDHLLITAGVGGTLAIVNWAPVWLWELLVRAETSQLSTARLAAAEERLRFSRDVHDVLGHDLTVIALKSELAARVAVSDPHTAAREATEVRRLAETALDRVRATAAGYRDVDLSAELAQIASLLRTAGVRCELDVDGTHVPPTLGSALSAVAREATTNVLRHSTARSCRIELARSDDGLRLVVSNDGARPAHEGTTSGSGLSGMSWRLAPLGGSVVAEHRGDTFTVRAWVPARP